jgi:hypothetical protein
MCRFVRVDSKTGGLDQAKNDSRKLVNKKREVVAKLRITNASHRDTERSTRKQQKDQYFRPTAHR